MSKTFRVRVKASLKNAALVCAREKLGFSTRKAAEGIGIAYVTLWNIESMRCYPRAKSIRKIIDYYRSCGIFLLEEDVFPDELKKVKMRSIVTERSIDPKRIVQLSDAMQRLSVDGDSKYLEYLEYLPRALDKLSDQEAKVIRMRFGLDGHKSTLDSIADELNYTRENIRQINLKALQKLEMILQRLSSPTTED